MTAATSDSLSMSQPPARLRLSSPAEILTAVPYLIGFAPKRSLVVMCLQGKQVGLTMRLDLDVPRAQLRKLVIERIRADNASSVVFALFDPDPGSGGERPGADLARALIRALERARIGVKDALGVRAGRYWSYLCREVTCCPPGGLPVPAAGDDGYSRVAATFVGLGAAPLASREELEQTVAPVTGDRLEAVEAAYEQVLGKPVKHSLGSWMAAVARYREGPRRPAGMLTPVEAVRLIMAIQRVSIRDALLGWTAGPERDGILGVLRELAPQALEPFDSQVLASLAWAAYAGGDGALAAVALERALTSNPGHKLARLMAQVLEAGISPDRLVQIGRDLRELSRTATDVTE